MIFAVDFDGTCVHHDYPGIGLEVTGAVETLKWLQSRGHRIILWTVRHGEPLERAQLWFHVDGIDLYGVNNNPSQDFWSSSQKVHADVFIDDRGLGCPLCIDQDQPRPVVDWAEVRRILEGMEGV